MALTYFNPAKRSRKRRKLWGAALAAHQKKLGHKVGGKKKRKGKRRKLWGAALAARQAKLARRTKRRGRSSKVTRAAKRRARTNPHKRKRKMARKKLYGAAARAHARKHRRGRRRKGRRGGRKSSWRVRAGKKAARTRARKKAMRRAAARVGRRKRRRSGRSRRKNGARRRRRSVAVVVSNPGRRRRRRRHHRRNPSRRRRRFHARRHNARRRRRRNPRPTTQRSILRARRSIRNRYKTSLARATYRRYRMRSNPAFSSIKGGVKDFAKQVLPVAFALYGARAVSSKLLTVNIPGFNSIPLQYQSPAMAGIVFVGAHFLTKKVRFLNKWRGGIMIGTGINLVDQVLSAIAPANVKQLFGLAGMGDYVEMGDYLSVGATPIDDDITLRDYVEVGVEEELGLDEELGLEEELGALQTATGTGPLNRAYLGGVSRGSMLKQIPSSPMLAAVPERSFTRRVPQAGAGYDNAESVYGGIFGGGF